MTPEACGSICSGTCGCRLWYTTSADQLTHGVCALRQDMHHLGVTAPSSSVPYGTFRAQKRLYGRDQPLKDKLSHIIITQQGAGEYIAAQETQ